MRKMAYSILLILLSISVSLAFNNFYYKHYSGHLDSEEDDNSVLRTYRRCICLDILPDQCEQGDEEDLMYKPFPDCCPVYCNLKRRMQRLKNMHIRHRLLLNNQQRQAATGATSALLNEYGLKNY